MKIFELNLEQSCKLWDGVRLWKWSKVTFSDVGKRDVPKAADLLFNNEYITVDF